MPGTGQVSWSGTHRHTGPEAAAGGSLSPASSCCSYWDLECTEEAIDVAAGYGAEQWQRLQAVGAAIDPAGRVVANHAVPRRA